MALKVGQKPKKVPDKPGADVYHLVNCWTKFLPLEAPPVSFAQSLLRLLCPALPCCAAILLFASTASFGQRVSPNIIVPSSSIERSEDIGRRVHTMHVIRVGV